MTRTPTRLAALAFLTALAGCGQEAPDGRQHAVYASVAWEEGQAPLAELLASEVELQEFDFQTGSPTEFLDFLTEPGAAPANDAALASPFTCFTVRGTHRGWVRDADLAELALRLDSEVPCRAVVMETSSFLPTDPSTIGREAAALIEGHRAETEHESYGGWPARLVSNPNPDREALREWARTHAP